MVSVSALGGPSAGAFARPAGAGSRPGDSPESGSSGTTPLTPRPLTPRPLTPPPLIPLRLSPLRPDSTAPDSAAPDSAAALRRSAALVPLAGVRRARVRVVLRVRVLRPSYCHSAGAVPVTAAQALASLSGALEFLAGADASEWPAGLQADCLRALAVAESRAAAVHARVLAAFCVPGGGLAGDGHRSARVWLSWQTQSTARSAAGKVAWMRRLAGHPVLAAALAAGTVSVSWAAQFAAWTGDLPGRRPATRPTLICWPAPGGARTWAPSLAWPRTCAAPTPPPTPTATARRSSLTGRSGSRRRSAAPGGWKGT